MKSVKIQPTNNQIVQLKKGDGKAFLELYHLYHKQVYYFSFCYLKSKEDAEELVQDVFVKIWEKRGELNEKLSFTNLLYTIAKNKILDIFRKRLHQEKYLKNLTYSADGSENTTDNDIAYSDLRNFSNKIIEQLPPRQKLIFEMSRHKGMSQKEIAEKLNISVKTVENQMGQALKFIRKALDDCDNIAMLLLFF